MGFVVIDTVKYWQLEPDDLIYIGSEAMTVDSINDLGSFIDITVINDEGDSEIHTRSADDNVDILGIGDD